MSSRAPLHLVRVPIDSQKLYAFSRRNRIPARNFDEGYAVHALMSALFDHGADQSARVAPKPFALPATPQRRFDVLGYTSADRATLIERARTFADPTAWDLIDLEAIASRPMPEAFPVGTRLGCTTRVCPVRRVAKRGKQEKERAEIDVFLAKVWEVDDQSVKLDREHVYREWLAQELAKGGAKVVQATMASFQLGRQHRRTQRSGEQTKREGRVVSHPEVMFDALLEVADPELFSAMLARGVGRHRSFGFGMLLLRPGPRSGS